MKAEDLTRTTLAGYVAGLAERHDNPHADHHGNGLYTAAWMAWEDGYVQGEIHRLAIEANALAANLGIRTHRLDGCACCS